VIAVSAVKLVISALAPLAAAPRFVRAPEAVFAFVPPFATGSCPVNVMLPAADRAMLPLAETTNVPLASGIVIVRAAVAVHVNLKLFVAEPPT